MSKIKPLIILLAATLVGCSSGETNTTISVQVETEWIPYYEQAIARVLEDNPDVIINLIEMGSLDNIELILSTNATNKDVADVFALPLDRIYSLAPNHVLAEIDALGMAETLGGFNDYNEGLGGSFKLYDEYLAFPFNIETLIVYANTANAQQNNVQLTGMIEFNDLSYGDMLTPMHDAWFAISFINSANLVLLDYNENGELYSDLTKDFAALNSVQQQFFASLFNYWQAHETAGTGLWNLNTAWDYINSEFYSGNANSLRIDGPWAAPSMTEKTNDGADLAVLPLDQITLNNKSLTHWKSGWGLAVNARLEGQEAEMELAQQIIMEIVNPEYAVDIFQELGKVLANVPASVYAESELTDLEKNIIIAMLESYETAELRPLFTEWAQVWPTWENAILSWSSVKPKSTEEAYAQIQASFIAMMASF